MRIRSIRPEFWSSEDVAALDWHDRLVFVGLWSYVDDNGVGRDVERLIVADLFPLDEDLQEASVRVHGALQRLTAGGQITRYTVEGKPYLHVTAFSTHQVINRPSRGRYPLPTCADATTHGALTEPSVSPPASDVIGEGEKGRRGEVTTPSGKPDETPGFAEFYDAYPRKEARRKAEQAYRAALKRTDHETIMEGVRRFPFEADPGRRKFNPLPASWLNADRWADEAGAGSDGHGSTEGDAAFRDAQDRMAMRGKYKPWTPPIGAVWSDDVDGWVLDGERVSQ